MDRAPRMLPVVCDLVREGDREGDRRRERERETCCDDGWMVSEWTDSGRWVTN
jgi:hypothetical protein